jgi:hypothetical protein
LQDVGPSSLWATCEQRVDQWQLQQGVELAQ